MEIEIVSASHVCGTCQADIAPGSRFCTHCGNLQRSPEELEIPKTWAGLNQILFLFGLQLIICLVFKFVDGLDSFGDMLIVDTSMAGITVLFFAYNWKDNRKLLRWPNFSVQKLAMYCGVAFLSSLLVNYIVGWLNITLFDEDTNYYLFFLLSGHGKWWMIFCMAVTPALFEELAFRGVILQNLTKYVDQWQAVFVTSFLFAILHLTFISLFWLIPFAIFLSIVRLKEKTIWYGVCIHFCFNLTVCLLEILG